MDGQVHSNNVNSAFNGFRAAGELGIKRICYASSVNAIGLAYTNARGLAYADIYRSGLCKSAFKI